MCINELYLGEDLKISADLLHLLKVLQTCKLKWSIKHSESINLENCQSSDLQVYCFDTAASYSDGNLTLSKPLCILLINFFYLILFSYHQHTFHHKKGHRNFETSIFHLRLHILLTFRISHYDANAQSKKFISMTLLLFHESNNGAYHCFTKGNCLELILGLRCRGSQA